MNDNPNKKESESQRKLILDYLLTGLPLTPLDALIHFKCLRLSGRIEELRKEGYPIKTKLVAVDSGKRVAQYSI